MLLELSITNRKSTLLHPISIEGGMSGTSPTSSFGGPIVSSVVSAGPELLDVPGPPSSVVPTELEVGGGVVVLGPGPVVDASAPVDEPAVSGISPVCGLQASTGKP